MGYGMTSLSSVTGARWIVCGPLTAFVLGVASARSSAFAEDLLVFDTPAEARDFELQGDYTGRMVLRGMEQDVGFQVIATGQHDFTVVGYPGGLPGDGWNGGERLVTQVSGVRGRLVFASGGAAILRDREIDLHDDEGKQLGRLSKVERRSPTLGMSPPPHAIVLFDGSDGNAFEGGQMTSDGLLMPGAISRETFQDCRLHLEFRTPFMPTARSQARGNSGVYLQGRYEVQILDSFGLDGEDNECGGVYGVKRPDVNMAFPPGVWQTYDIDFTAPRFDDQGRKIANARISVRHNGVLIHREVSIPGPTRAAKLREGPEPGPLYLQDHGNPVRFRNVWIVRTSTDAPDAEAVETR